LILPHPRNIIGEDLIDRSRVMTVRRTVSIYGVICAVALLLVTSWTSNAVAQQIRFPQTGPVAFVIHLANGWTANSNADNILLHSPDNTSAIQLSILPGNAASTTDQVANQIIASMSGAKPFTRKEPTAWSGYNGYDYFSSGVNPSNVALNVEIIVIKPIGQFIALANIISPQKTTVAEQNSLEAMKQGIDLSAGN
jgi:hypothetical protein